MKCSTPYCRNQRVKHRTICEKCKSRIFKKRHPEAYHFNALRNNARRRGKKFTLTLAEFKQFCEKTGYMEGKGQTKNSLSIDRIRQNEGYDLNNIQVMTLSKNSIKSNKDYCPF